MHCALNTELRNVAQCTIDNARCSETKSSTSSYLLQAVNYKQLAVAMITYILAQFSTELASCDGPPPPPRCRRRGEFGVGGDRSVPCVPCRWRGRPGGSPRAPGGDTPCRPVTHSSPAMPFTQRASRGRHRPRLRAVRGGPERAQPSGNGKLPTDRKWRKNIQNAPNFGIPVYKLINSLLDLVIFVSLER